MAYLVLSRKYRPQVFEDVVGQEHVTRTLVNAISGNRVAHAILFSGPRGTGKTTLARILAKAMNCESGPVPTPCNTCRSCADITSGRGVDVFEIDGASNNSVDQIRELRGNIRYMPAHSRFKIYIIDEVHMLSLAAFNALLKTLEEPPAHVLFFFATTEHHKIPITILSRCQRHDLKRIDPAVIVKHMGSLCRQESVTIASESLWTIARQSGGSMRDALSLLDQILACGGGAVDDDYVMSLLGGMDRHVLFDLSAATLANDMSQLLSIIDGVFKNGQDLKRFYADVLHHFRHLMIIKIDAGSELLVDLSTGEIKDLKKQLEGVSLAFIDQVYSLLFNAEPTVRHAFYPRLAIEMVFFKIHQITPALPIDLLIERMDNLLNDPNLKAATGILETQSGYGETDPQPFTNSIHPGVDEKQKIGQEPEIPDTTKSSDSKSPIDGRAGHEAWEKVVAALSKIKPSVAAALTRSQLLSVSDSTFSVKVSDNDFSAKMIEKNLAVIEKICREHADREIDIDFSDGETETKQVEAVKLKTDTLRQQLLNHPLVADAVNIFNGTIDEIKIK